MQRKRGSADTVDRGISPVSILAGFESAREHRRRSATRLARGRITREYAIVPDRDCLSSTDSGKPVRGLRGEYFDNNRLAGAPRLVRTDPRIDFGWTLNSPGRGIPFDWYSVRWTGTLTAPAGGVRRIGVEGNDGYRLYLDGTLVDRQLEEAVVRRAARRRVACTPGSDARHPPRVLREHRQRAREARLGRRRRRRLAREDRRAPSPLARRSDVAIVVAGIEEGNSAIARSSVCPATRRS